MSDSGPDLPAAVRETHISTVFFVGDRVYKLKKPVKLGFLDFSTVAARERVVSTGGRAQPAFGPRRLPRCRRSARRRRTAVRPPGGDATDARRPPALHARPRRANRSTTAFARWLVRSPPSMRSADTSAVIAAAGSVDAVRARLGVELRDDATVRRLDPRRGCRVADRAARRGATSTAAARSSPIASRTARCETVTATCSPTTSSAWTTVRAFSTASSSTTGSATAMSLPTSPSSPWTSNEWARPDLGDRFLGVVPGVLRRELSGVARAPLHRLPGARPGQGRVPARRPGRRRERTTRPRSSCRSRTTPRAWPGRAHPRRRAAGHGEVDARGRPLRPARLDRAALRRGTEGSRRAGPHDPAFRGVSGRVSTTSAPPP